MKESCERTEEEASLSQNDFLNINPLSGKLF